MEYDRITLGRLAKEQGFVRDTLEKVCRLTDILLFMQKDGLLSGRLALKGGTAINLTVFDLPRAPALRGYRPGLCRRYRQGTDDGRPRKDSRPDWQVYGCSRLHAKLEIEIVSCPGLVCL